MRAKLSVEIPATTPHSFPSNEDVESRLIAMGYGTIGAPASYEERLKQYLHIAEEKWDTLPEAAAQERDYVIFAARLVHHGTLIVTRDTDGRAVLRVINEHLARLQTATERLVKELTTKVASLPGLSVDENRVDIYERGHMNVIIIGRVITSVSRETVARNPATAASAVVSAMSLVVSLVWLQYASPAPASILTGTLERLSTAMLAALLMAAVTLLQTWWTIRRTGGIDWEPIPADGK